MIKLLSLLAFSLILSGCWMVQDEDRDFKNSVESANNTSILGQIESNALLIEGKETNLTLNGLLNLSNRQLRNMDTIRIPVHLCYKLIKIYYYT